LGGSITAITGPRPTAMSTTAATAARPIEKTKSVVERVDEQSGEMKGLQALDQVSARSCQAHDRWGQEHRRDLQGHQSGSREPVQVYRDAPVHDRNTPGERRAARQAVLAGQQAVGSNEEYKKPFEPPDRASDVIKANPTAEQDDELKRQEAENDQPSAGAGDENGCREDSRCDRQEIQNLHGRDRRCNVIVWFGHRDAASSSLAPLPASASGHGLSSRLEQPRTDSPQVRA